MSWRCLFGWHRWEPVVCCLEGDYSVIGGRALYRIERCIDCRTRRHVLTRVIS